MTIGNDLQVGSSGSGSLSVIEAAKVSVGKNASVGLNDGSNNTLAVKGLGSSLEVLAGTTSIGDAGTGTATFGDGGTLTTVDVLIGNQPTGKGDVTVTDSGSAIAASDNLVVGKAGTGTLSVLAGGIANAKNVYVGQSKDSSGILRVDGASDDPPARSTLAAKQSIYVGDMGSGSMTVSGGGLASAEFNVVVGNGIAADGTKSVGNLTVTGVGSKLTAAREIYVGNNGIGSMNVTEGGHASAGSRLYVGTNAGSDGTLAITGPSSSVDVGLATVVGPSSTGKATISDGGALNTLDMWMGSTRDGKGSVTVDGAGSTLAVSRSMIVGSTGVGELSVLNGAQASALNASVGQSTGSTGTVRVDGAFDGLTSTLTASRSIYVGDMGNGAMTVSGGGRVSAKKDIVLANNPENPQGTGGLTVTGTGSKVSADEQIQVGNYGAGKVTVSDGGALTSGELWIGRNEGSTGDVAVTGTGSQLTSNAVLIGTLGEGTMAVADGGKVLAKTIYIGTDKNGKGRLDVTDADSKVEIGVLVVGSGGTGSMQVAKGAQVSVSDAAFVGAGNGSDGTLTITGASPVPGATASTMNVQGTTYVGLYGKGRAIVSEGGALTTGSLSVGTNAYVNNATNDSIIGNGSVAVDGAGSKLSVSSQLTVGDEGVGALSVSNGAKADASSMAVGKAAGSTGAVKVAGAGSQLTLINLMVGDAGTGTVEVSGGGAMSVKPTELTPVIGAQASSQGSVSVTGAGSKLDIVSNVTVGQSGTGTLTVSDGGQASVNTYVEMGQEAGSIGTLTVGGAGSKLSVGGTIGIGEAGTATVVVQGGGTLESETLVAGYLATGVGTLTVTGASPAAGVTASAVKVRSDTYVGFYGKGQAIVSDGGALTTGSLSVGTYSYFDNATNKTVSGDGSVTVDGAGSKLSVSGQLTVGELGVGTLSVSNGAKADAQSTSIGQGTGSTGTVKVAGAGSQLTLDDLTVADAGTGTVEVAGGGALNVKSTAVSTVIGAQTGAQGSVRVTGAGSTLGVASAVTVGESGVGTLSVADGARGTIGGNATLGTNAKGDGTVKVTGALSNLAVAGTTSVGQAGLGVALVDQGGQLGSAALQIGSAAAGLGYVGVDGAGSTLAVSQALDVGTSGRGVLSVSNGAQATSATTTLGSNAGSVGVVVLAGAGSALTTGDVFLGRNDQSDPASTTGGLSSFTVTDAATLHAGTVSVATSTGSAALLNIGAGASSAAATPGTIDAKNIVFGQGDGALVLNHTAQDLAFAPTIDGTGRVQALSGTTSLASGSTYAGGTSITGATTTLKGSATSFGTGAIRNDAALVIDQASDAAFANVMAGTGSLTKTGAGLLNVTGDSSGFTGATTVAAGRLAVNGSLSGSAVTVQSGATLSGAGTVGSARAQSGATVAPGNSPGTLSVAGDYHQAAGATYAAEVVPGSTVSDQIAVSGVTTLDSGAILNVSKYGTGSYRSGARYTVLTSLGGVKGTYTLTGDTAASAFFSLGATYDANHVYLDYTQSHTFADFAKTPNETAAASGLQKLADSDALRTKVLALRTGAQAQRAYDQLSGELHASTRTVLLQDSRFMRDATTRQVYASGNGNGNGASTGTGVDSRKDSGESVWAHAYGASGRYDGDGNAAGLQRDIGGLFAGTDAAVSADTRLGIVGGYGRSRITLQESRGSATVDTYGLGLYGATQWDRARASYGVNEAWHKLSTSRSVGLEGFADQLSADYRARSTQLYGDVGYRMGAELGLAPAALEPFASLAWVDLRTSGAQERGGAAALGVAKGSTRVGFATLGLRSAATLDIGGVPVVASALLGWRGVLGGTTPSSANGFAGGTGAAGFVVQGVPLARNVAALEANVSAALTPTLTLGLAYAGQIGPGFSDHGIRASLSLKF
ncbi:autotransporter domain-containing protein [Variovorax sp. PvP013]|uniref:autotransporter domain-containing protein n=1 Tax=Variovorax sp. PvP013 TaxID=3156435 RepID=UPI003D21BA60